MPIPTLACAAVLAAPWRAEAGELTAAQGPDMTRYVVVCVGLLIAIVVVAAALKRLFGRALTRRAAARSLQVMDVLPLGGKQRLAVVRCYDRTFLLGLGEKELTAISELDAVIAPQSAPAPSRADAQAFASVLERVAPKLAVERLRKEGILG